MALLIENYPKKGKKKEKKSVTFNQWKSALASYNSSNKDVYWRIPQKGTKDYNNVFNLARQR